MDTLFLYLKRVILNVIIFLCKHYTGVRGNGVILKKNKERKGYTSIDSYLKENNLDNDIKSVTNVNIFLWMEKKRIFI